MLSGILTAVFGFVLRTASSGILSRVLTTLGGDTSARTMVTIAEINAEIETRKAIRDVRIATAGFWEMRLMTFLIVTPFCAHLWLVALDTMFALGWRISAFPKPFDEWQGAILLSFFGVHVGMKAITSFAGVLTRWLGGR